MAVVVIGDGTPAAGMPVVIIGDGLASAGMLVVVDGDGLASAGMLVVVDGDAVASAGMLEVVNGDDLCSIGMPVVINGNGAFSVGLSRSGSPPADGFVHAPAIGLGARPPKPSRYPFVRGVISMKESGRESIMAGEAFDAAYRCRIHVTRRVKAEN
ncbi:hypothetical protein KZ829_16555 [Actinoplanes hulinensis]|uniref:PAAR motif-containing protein n=1 Tax=Actinoplanes hulinensis TaxID=1144547 RepID=A0ABS7B300_9ACTN|nr:hypothetical protein [Actinoplanes hulinensis]MBW6435350.1 hypothetical protein [Actinoplanes hulinensis]